MPRFVVDDEAHETVVLLLDADRSLRADLAARDAFGERFQVHVAGAEAHAPAALPAIAGRYDVIDDAIRFTPYAPLERGIAHRATFNPRPLAAAATFDFTLAPGPPQPRTIVERIHPSGDVLPENLLRFHVVFSGPMRRGRCDDAIALLDSDGEPVTDALYRPPVELWDRSMRFLTILLDPGRLKRRLGPHRALGPPLREGRGYTLRIGAAMRDASGRPLAAAVDRTFRVGPPVRTAIAPDRWSVTRPRAGTFDPLQLTFPHPLDWALLARAVRVVCENGDRIVGRATIDAAERRWRLAPASPWSTERHRVLVDADLEDVCGNRLESPFDRPIRAVAEATPPLSERSIAFLPR